MKPLSPLVFAISLLCASSAFAERFGSETSIIVQGVYYQAGETVSAEMPNGDVRSTATQTTARVSNRTILEAMRDRNLITGISGYRLVMVAHGHMADGVAWFATKNSGTPVTVPSDLLSMDVSDGPANGQWVVNADAVLKSLRQQTMNQTSLSLAGGFAGTGLLTQTWTARSVKNGDTTEMVELVSSSGSFSGVLNGSPADGVGIAQLTLADAKIVDLTTYGMATTGSVSTGGSYGVTVSSSSSGSLTVGSIGTSSSTTNLTSGVLTFNNATGTLSISNTLTINSGTLNLSNATFFATSTLKINTTTGGTVTGLVIDADGNVTQFPTFGSSLPGTLIIITSSGTHTYTHDSNGAWTLVTG